mmetsp:Transcript_17214/g.40370  ORF Transcript_17214/g.40370 Transcript_17214/m.40370 type:complete len:218 (+) Transcript_17214:323-976(+)
MAAQASAMDAERAIKCLVVGDAGIGKTSFVKRTVNEGFFETYKTTVGVDFKIKRMQVNNESVRLQLWDIMGQERFQELVRVYYQNTRGVFIIYDLTKQKKSLKGVLEWKKEIDTKVRLPDGSPVPTVLLGNKCDMLEDRSKAQAELDEFCQQNGFLGGFLTSAKNDTNVHEATAFLVSEILNTQTFEEPAAVKNTIGGDGETWSPFGASGSVNSGCC